MVIYDRNDSTIVIYDRNENGLYYKKIYDRKTFIVQATGQPPMQFLTQKKNSATTLTTTTFNPLLDSIIHETHF
jgi:hypothetical protein